MFMLPAHFTSDQFELNRVDGIRKQKPLAIPTVFSHRPMKKGRKPPAKRSTIDEITMKKRRKQYSGISCDEFPSPMQDFPDEDPENADDSDLHGKVAEVTRKLDLARKELRKMENKYEMLQKSIRSLFNEEQLNALSKPVRRGCTWSDETIQKGLKLRLACGTNGYNLLINCGYPLPSERTLRLKIFQTSRSTSYENDDHVHLLNYMHLRSEDSMSFSSVNDEDEVEMEELGDDEANSLFYLTGRTVRQILPHISGCEKCKDAVEGGDELPDVSLLTELKDYTGSSLIKPSKSVFAVVKTAERCLRDQRESILKGVITHSRIVSLALEGTESSDIPTCHNVIGKLIKNYTRTRLHILVREFNSKLRSENSVKCGSRSIGMRMALHKL
ncbi:hypothetical protein J437_LFUL016846 [Ladona fulva]|uniref:Uncharacterized protein n=1 Tax=Ladona fulva TaxID=123851 RepID=A0A8K0P9L9_LADFU|nr:hypothetical protein J437_LFUL016846 [Ladona fulva]